MDLKLEIEKSGISFSASTGVINEEYTLRYGHIFRGQSAYEQAVAGGYKGTKEEFEAAIAKIDSMLTTDDVVNDLSSAASDKPLSANQGGELNRSKVGYAEYNSQRKAIVGYDNQSKGRELFSIDATTFIKDGMISEVSINSETQIITVTFNTDAGKEPIDVDLSVILAQKADKAYVVKNVEIGDNLMSAILAFVVGTHQILMPVVIPEGVVYSAAQFFTDTATGGRLTACVVYGTKQYVRHIFLDSNFVVTEVGETNEIGDSIKEDGYYPSMTVGKAENLVGRGEATQEEFSFRPSAGDLSIEDGTARITSIKGNSVVWNQLVHPIASSSQNGVTIVNNGDGSYSVYTDEGGATSKTVFYTQQHKGKLKHKLFLAGAPNGSTANTYYMQDGWSGVRDFGSGKFYTSASDTIQVSIVIMEGTIITEPITFKPQLIDLTQMFGAGNEPTSYKEYLQRKPMNIADEYEYNSGEVIPMKVDEIKSVGNNAYDYRKGYARVVGGKEYFLDGEIQNNPQFSTTIDGEREDLEFYAQESMSFPNDGYLWVEGSNICVCLRHSYDKPFTQYEEDSADLSWIYSIKDDDGNLLFENGLRSAGTAHDEVRYNRTTKKWEAVKRIGEVDLGSLSWQYKEAYQCFNSVESFFVPSGQGITAIYELNNIAASAILDKQISFHTSFGTGKVFIKDSGYTDAQTFKSAMDGVKLYYQLTKPIEMEIPNSENLNLNYLVWDFGTEEAVASGASTPFRADIVYQFNAVDRIRNNSTKIEELGAKINKNTADIATKQKTLTLTVKDNGNIVIGNLDGQTKEFMPATPSGVAEHYTWLKYDGVTYGTFIGADGNTYGQEGKWGVYAERGGLADLTNDDMRIVVANMRSLSKAPALFAASKGRTNIIVNNNTFIMSYSGEFSQMFRNCTTLKVANLCVNDKNKICNPVSLSNSFVSCKSMHTIIGEIGGQYLTNTTSCFAGCSALKEVRISGLKVSISFVDSPLLSYGSVLYMLDNCDFASNIIITLHPDCYDRVTGEEDESGDIQAFLQNYTNIQLARG